LSYFGPDKNVTVKVQVLGSETGPVQTTSDGISLAGNLGVDVSVEGAPAFYMGLQYDLGVMLYPKDGKAMGEFTKYVIKPFTDFESSIPDLTSDGLYQTINGFV